MASSDTESKSDFEPHIGRSVSLDHAAELLGVSRRTIYNRIRENRLRTIRTTGGSQRVLIESIEGKNDGAIDAGPTPSRDRREALLQDRRQAPQRDRREANRRF